MITLGGIVKYLFFTIFLFFISIFILNWLSPVDTSPLTKVSKVIYSDSKEWLFVETSPEQKWRFATDSKRVDPNFIKILLAYEDKRFYKHWGLDPLAMSRAILQLIKNQKVISGGSTITMQLARLLHPRKRTVLSKIIEIFRAFQLEWIYSKEEILSAYLTLTPYGGNIEGLVAASMRYFGKLPYSLSAEEIALLVALPQSPERNRPDKHPTNSKKARNKVLSMAKEKILISEYEYKQAINKKTPSTLKRYPRYTPHLSHKILSKDKNSTKRIKTTINKDLQKQLELWAKSKENTLAKETTIAVLVVRNSDSAIQAYLGSHNMFSKNVAGYVDMIKAIRSPGSTLKPFIYALGFEKHIIHPHTLILDQETRFGDYMPHNFSNQYNGEVTLEYALQNSLNIPAVKILQKLGADEFISTINNYVGLVKVPKDRASLPVALGGLGISMWQLTQLYVALANGGSTRELHYLISDKKKTKSKKLFTEKATKMTSSILRNTPAPKGFINSDKQIAYKTGTSYGYRDAWTIAYNSQYTVATWVGKPNNTIQLKLTGKDTAAPLAFEVFSLLNTLLPKKSWLTPSNYLGNSVPDGLKYFDKEIQIKQAKLDFVYPRENTRFRSAGCGKAVVEVKVENGKPPYYWYIDGEAREISEDYTNIPFEHGAHTINVIDSNGETITRDIWVDKPEC